MHKKSQIVIALILAIISLFAAGWFFYLYGGKKPASRTGGDSQPAGERVAIDKIQKEYQLLSKVTESGDDALCRELEDPDNIDACFRTASQVKNDPVICEKIASTTAKISCLERLKFNAALVSGDFRQCSGLTAESDKQDCYVYYYSQWADPKRCGELEKAYQKDCQSRLIEEQALGKRDVQACSGIQGEQEQKSCQEAVASLPPDTDGDGLEDAFEISIATDPFKRDTDGDKIDDLKEILKKTDPKNAKSK